MPNVIPGPIQTLVQLFTTSLADVRFADVDGQTLERCAAEVECAAGAVAAAQAVLDAAREAMQLKQDVLLQRAQSALAYARVYAENDEALSAELDGVSLPRSTRRPRADEGLVLSSEPQTAPRPRGRPRKARVAETCVEALALPAE